MKAMEQCKSFFPLKTATVILTLTPSTWNRNLFEIVIPNIQSNFNGSNTFGTIKICSRQGKFKPMMVDNSARSGGIIKIFLIFYNMKVYCAFSLESPHWGDSNEYTQYTVFNIKKKITLNFLNLQPRDYFLGTQERVRNSHGKRAISVRAIEVLL